MMPREEATMGDHDVKYPPADEPGVLGKPFRKALGWAAKLHEQQHRKGKPQVPYVSHLLAVTAIVLEASGTETEAIAALLHDAIEDQDVSDDDIRRRFGPRVVEIVRGCTDGLVAPGDDPEQPDFVASERSADNWAARKAAYLDHLAELDDPNTLLVTAADKLHNARSIVDDLRTAPPAWTRFNGPPVQQLEYYAGVRKVLAGRIPAPLDRELRAAVDEMALLTNVEVETAAWRDAHPDLGPYDG
jgi:(p)ppGpp synthase/HD superfamily hydrolase